MKLSPWSARTHLALLAAALTLPILAFAAVLLWHLAFAEQERLQREALEDARHIAQGVDRLLADLLSSARILALTQHVREGEREQFYELSRKIHDDLGIVATLSRVDGQQIVSPLVPAGQALPRSLSPWDRTVLSTRQPAVSDLFRGIISGHLQFSVTVPVLDEAQTLRSLLRVSFPISQLQTLIEETAVASSWVVAVVDRSGTIMARNIRPEEFVGQPATRDLQENTLLQEGTWLGFTVDGRPVMGAYAKSELADWRIAIGVDRAELMAPVKQSMRWFAGLGAMLLTTAGLLAWRFGQRLTAAIRGLAETAAAVGRGEPVAPQHSSVAEVRDVEQALAEASSELMWSATALRESEERLRLALEAGRMAVWEVSLQTEELVGSPKLNSLFGFPPEASLTLDDLRSRFAPGERERMNAELQRTLSEGGNSLDLEFRCLWPSGEEHWLLLRGLVHLNEAGAVKSIVGVLFDITERKEGEAADALLAAFVTASPYPMASVSTEGVIQSWNPAAEALFGYCATEAIGAPASLLVPPTCPDGPNGIFNRVLAGETVQVEDLRARKDGTLVDIAINGAPIRDETGEVVGVAVIHRDISARKDAERRRQLLINELNHRVKNTLASVHSIARQTLRNSTDVDAACEAFEGRLLALSRAHNVLTRESWEGANLTEIVAEALAPYSDLHEDRIILNGPEVRLQPGFALSMAMVLQELATNAVKYGALSNASGQLKIAWKLTVLDEEQQLQLEWTEQGGPPVVAPSRRGFGSRLLKQGIDGQKTIHFDLTGLVFRLNAKLRAEPPLDTPSY